MYKFSIIACLVLMSCAPSVAVASNYGPPDTSVKEFEWPDKFEQRFDERTEDAQKRYDSVRKDATRWEIAYQVLNVVDAAQTIDCLKRKVCVEANPLLGKRPSTEKIVGVKSAVGVIHWFLFTKIRKHDPYKARTMARVSVVLQGSVVAANMRFTF
jgi:hypothetical protein